MGREGERGKQERRVEGGKERGRKDWTSVWERWWRESWNVEKGGRETENEERV